MCDPDRGIFLNFFPCRKATDPLAAVQEEGAAEDPKSSLRPPMQARKRTSMHAVPLIEEAELKVLAKQFADAIPENELSVSLLSFSLVLGELIVPGDDRWRVCRVIS